MRLQKKSLSKINLADLLRRRKSTLEKFLDETGIVTYALLKQRCASIGVIPPTEEYFMQTKGNPVTHEISSPTEGIIVINPLPEITDENISESSFSLENDAEIDDNAVDGSVVSLEQQSQKKKKIHRASKDR